MECDVHFCRGISHQMTENVSIEVTLKKVTRVRHPKEGFQGKTQRSKTKKFKAATQLALSLNLKIRNNFNNNYC